MNSTFKLLALDPSLRGFGFSLGHKLFGTFNYSKLNENPYLDIFTELEHLIVHKDITHIIKEGYAFGFNNRGMTKIVELGGIIQLLVEKYSLKIVTVPPKTLKKIISGNGNASKDDVAHSLMSLYGTIEFEDDNQSDALAMWTVGKHYHKLLSNKDDYGVKTIASIRENISSSIGLN